MSEDKKTNIVAFSDHAKNEGAQASGNVLNLLPECPEYLSPLAKQHWPELVESLGSHGIINELDKDMLGIYCSMMARFITLDEALNDPEGPGVTQKTPKGYEVETATYNSWKGLIKPLMSYAGKLGLTPPARLALKMSDPSQEKLNF